MAVKKALDVFGTAVVKGARKELVRQDKNASKSLSKSLDFKVKVSKNSFQFDFLMEDYGEFIDKGVHGVGGTKADGSKWKKKKVVGSKFRYTNKRPPTQAFNGWTIRRGIAPRSKGGQFTSRKGLLFAIANSVYHTGLETTNFLTKPFNKAFKTFPQDIAEAFGLEAEKLLEIALA